MREKEVVTDSLRIFASKRDSMENIVMGWLHYIFLIILWMKWKGGSRIVRITIIFLLVIPVFFCHQMLFVKHLYQSVMDCNFFLLNILLKKLIDVVLWMFSYLFWIRKEGRLEYVFFCKTLNLPLNQFSSHISSFHSFNHQFNWPLTTVRIVDVTRVR